MNRLLTELLTDFSGQTVDNLLKSFFLFSGNSKEMYYICANTKTKKYERGNF